MKVKNLNEAKALVKRYREITYEEIFEVTKAAYVDNLDKARLTGFGNPNTCTLCKAVNLDCNSCIHNVLGHDLANIDCICHPTYDRISHARSIKSLLEAYKARADYLETIINNYESNNK